MLYAPHNKQKEVHQNPARFKVLNWGRRTGKSTLAVNYTIAMALAKYDQYIIKQKQVTHTFRYFIVAPTYRQAKSIFWNDIVKTQVPREIVANTNETELSLEINHYLKPDKDGNPVGANLHPNVVDLPAITIELKGAENEDSLRGSRLSGVVLDEYAFMKPLVWDKVLRPQLSDDKGWAVFISTPDGFNHFHQLSEKAQREKNWFYSHATIYDNPHISVDEVNDIKAEELGKDDEGDTWYQEYMADFRQMKGLVYKQFHVNTHVVQPEDIPQDGTNLIGIDFGWENPTAAVFVRIDHDNNWYIYNEIYDRHLHTDRLRELLRDRMTGTYFTTIVGDSAQAQQIAELKAQKIPIQAVKKGKLGTKSSIDGGIRLIQDMLRVQPGTGKPRIFVSAACKNVIHELETYAFEQVADESGRLKDVPKKENDHAMDALRYIALTRHEYRKPFVRTKKVYNEFTGRRVA